MMQSPLPRVHNSASRSVEAVRDLVEVLGNKFLSRSGVNVGVSYQRELRRQPSLAGAPTLDTLRGRDGTQDTLEVCHADSDEPPSHP